MGCFCSGKITWCSTK